MFSVADSRIPNAGQVPYFAKKPYQVFFARYKRLQQEGLTRNLGAFAILFLVYPGKRRWTERDIEIIPLNEFLSGFPGFLTVPASDSKLPTASV